MRSLRLELMRLSPVDESFGEFYASEVQAVYRAVYFLSGSGSVAEEATQEAFVRAMERWTRLHGQSWRGGWVMRTALNLARRALRRGPSLPPSPPGPERDVEGALDLRRAIRSLSLRQQEAVLLRFGRDLSLSDVAAAMGCREGTVKAHLDRALKALRLQMAELDR